MTDDMDIDIDVEETIPEIRPTLFDINKSFDVLKNTDGRYVGIRGEEEARMVVFTNFVLGEKPVILKGSRASGKTNIMEVTSMYAHSPITIASSSEKAYQRNKNLNKHSHFIIPEVNKINEKTVEMLKDFGEGADHQYSFTNPYKETETILIQAKPFITSIADENKNVNLLGEELISRLTVVRTDSSIKQNVAVIREKLKRAENPFYKKGISQTKVKQYVDYVKSLPSIRSFTFIYPAGEEMYKAIPPLFTDSRRDTDKYLANTYGITLFHYFDRIRKTIDSKSYLFVTPADMWYNHVIYQNVLLESSLKCGRIEKEILDVLKIHGENIRQDEWGNKVKGMKIGDVHTELLKRSFTPTVESVRKYCDNLMEVGYITRNEELRPFRYSLNPELQREYQLHIDWQTIVEQCKKSISTNFPDVADEYISRFCENGGLTVVHPFTGEKLNLLDTTEKVVPQKVEEKKVDKVDTISFITEEKPIVIEDDDMDFETDRGDNIEHDIMTVLDDGVVHPFSDLQVFGYTDDELLTTLKYLMSIGEVIKNGNDSYQVLR
jgi:hypothetical protein